MVTREKVRRRSDWLVRRILDQLLGLALGALFVGAMSQLTTGKQMARLETKLATVEIEMSGLRRDVNRLLGDQGDR